MADSPETSGGATPSVGASMADLIAREHEYHAIERNARETLHFLLSLPRYLPTLVGSGPGTYVAATILYGWTHGRQDLFRNRFLDVRLRALQRFLFPEERAILSQMVRGPDLRGARRAIMAKHAELITLFRKIVACTRGTDDH